MLSRCTNAVRYKVDELRLSMAKGKAMNTGREDMHGLMVTLRGRHGRAKWAQFRVLLSPLPSSKALDSSN
jgi:hypothetical protein